MRSEREYERLLPSIVDEWVADGVLDNDPQLGTVSVHPGGLNRDTVVFDLADSSRGFVLRVDLSAHDQTPTHPLVADVSAEAAAMRAVASDVPVPSVHAAGYSRTLDAPYVLTERCPGRALNVWDPDDRTRLASYREHPDGLPAAFVDRLAAIHRSPPAAFDHTPPAERVRQLRRFTEQVGPAAQPVVSEVFRWLAANAPEPTDPTLIHGDYRIGNLLVDDGEIAAVIDWEMTRAGDPAFDLGLASLSYFAGELFAPTGTEPVCRLLSEERLLRRYRNRTGRSVPPARLRFWQVFALATIVSFDFAAMSRLRAGEGEIAHAWYQFTVPAVLSRLLELIRE